MRWQDIVISVAQLIAVFSLMPSIFSEDKPALATCAMDFVLVSIIASCLLSLGLWFSAATAYCIAIAWLVLLVQKYRIDHPKSK